MGNARETYEVRDVPETVGWQSMRHYQNRFLNVFSGGWLCGKRYLDVLRECRKFYFGDQYAKNIPNIPRPMLNLCREKVSKIAAKIVGTPFSVMFYSDVDDDKMKSLEDFYDYQMLQMKDKEFTDMVATRAYIDGVCFVYTAYDSDTLGVRGMYRGYLKRRIIPVEQMFVENPYEQDIQAQQYVGYSFETSVGAAKELIRGSDTFRKRAEALLMADNTPETGGRHTDDDRITLVNRFYRDNDGEVCFMVSSQYADLFESPQYLNPAIRAKNPGVGEGSELDKEISDYENIGQRRIDISAVPERQTEGGYRREQGRFWLYPFTYFAPDPDLIDMTMLGQSGVYELIENQKVTNYNYLLATMIVQNYAIPKTLVKPGALKGQVINNDPAQVLVDYSIASTGQWGIKKLEAQATSPELLNFNSMFVNETRQIGGFANLASDTASDTSGYALQQVKQEMNLSLEIPQRRLWDYKKENARVDLMYFKHYIDSAYYFVRMDDSEYQLQSRYREMGADIASISGQPKPPDVRGTYRREITNDDFMGDWQVVIDAEQGIGHSEISESQHFNQVFQYVASGNLDPELVMAFVNSDPGFSRRVRRDLKAGMEVAETSQIAQKNAEIEQYKQVIENLSGQIKEYGQQIQYMNMQVKAYKKATTENAKLNQAVATASAKSEGQVKSDNARGLSGDETDYTMGEDSYF